MNETQIRSVALFFFFTLLDEELAENACRHAISRLRGRYDLPRFKKKTNQADIEATMVREMFQAFETTRAHHVLNKASLNQRHHFQTPAGVSFGAWRQFHKEASPEDLLAVVLCQILGFTPSVTASGLGVTVGSVRYRIGRGLRQLGRLITLGEIRA